LRAPLSVQLARADALVVVGTSKARDGVMAVAGERAVPVFHASLQPDAAVVDALAGARVLAFAGIGDPEKLFATLAGARIGVAVTRSFADHHRYTAGEAEMLCQQADREALMLVTTEKDLARMQGDTQVAALAARARALPVTFTFEDPAAFLRLLRARLAAAR
jgi:tetraacyldisaccharide 4'-kinase